MGLTKVTRGVIEAFENYDVNNINATGIVTASTFIGDGSGITGVTASGVGIEIKDSSTIVGVAGTIDFGTNLNVSPASAGIVTVTTGDGDFSIVDKIVHTGDTDTAIRFPAADTFTVETAGSERVRVSSAGNVGIGTDNPTATLDVNGTLNVTGVSTFQGNVDILDDDRLRFGDGQDLQIYHNSSNNNSVIQETGSGDLNILANDLNIRNQAGNETIAAFRQDGAVSLNYDNSKKFETTTTGIEVSNGASTSATIAGPDEIIIDPATVGDDTGSVRIKGDLYVDGNTTQINSTTIELADFIVGIATTATTDTLADGAGIQIGPCLLYTSPSPRDLSTSRMPSSA